jgi:hypothetical protein
LERQLKAAEGRVANATRLMVEMPDDLDIRCQREADQAEVRRLTAAREAQRRTGTAPTEKEIAKATRPLLQAIGNAAPDKAREAPARAMAPILLTPKIEGADHLVEVTGSLDLVPSFPGFGSSGGAVCTSIYGVWRAFRA